eukprot:1774312-Amphidinium_carterae.1
MSAGGTRTAGAIGVGKTHVRKILCEKFPRLSGFVTVDYDELRSCHDARSFTLASGCLLVPSTVGGFYLLTCKTVVSSMRDDKLYGRSRLPEWEPLLDQEKFSADAPKTAPVKTQGNNALVSRA